MVCVQPDHTQEMNSSDSWTTAASSKMELDGRPCGLQNTIKMQLKNSAGMSLSRNHDMFPKTLLWAFLCFIFILCFIILFLLSTGALICRMSEVVGRCSKRENTWIHETAHSMFMIYGKRLFTYLLFSLIYLFFGTLGTTKQVPFRVHYIKEKSNIS